MVARRAAPHRLRRGEPHLAVDRRLLAASSEVVARHRRRPDVHAARSRCSLPSLRVDAFTVGIAAEIQKARRTGLTFAPEAGTWRMRQVINKLITEEDLYGAVESAFSQGWRRMKLYFLTGLPTETDEDTLGIAELARQLRRDRREHHTRARRSRSRSAGFVPKPLTPFQWFGQNTVGRAAAQGRPAARRPRAATGACSSSGTTRRPRWPRASPAGAIAASGPVIEDVWRARRHLPGVVRALRPRPLGRGHGAPRARRSTGTSTATAPSTRCCPGTTSRPACTRTSCGRTGRTPSPSSASRTAAGRPATTAAPAPATASSTSWPRPTPPAGGSQGTGQDLAGGGARAGRRARAPARGDGA